MKILLMIDMQNDFINGALGNKEARAVFPKVCERVRDFVSDNADRFFYTMDTHYENYLETREGKKLPVIHCIKNTEGWKLSGQLNEIIAGVPENNRIEKNTFGSQTLPSIIKSSGAEIDEIEIIGVCTDICVISNAIILKAFFPEARVVVDSSLCAGTSKEAHKTALEAMKMCCIDIR